MQKEKICLKLNSLNYQDFFLALCTPERSGSFQTSFTLLFSIVYLIIINEPNETHWIQPSKGLISPPN